MTEADTVVLVNLGTPAALDERSVREFLAEFLADPLVVDWPRWLWLPLLRGVILRRRPARALELYRSIWTGEGSPLAAGTQRLARSLGVRLAGEARVVAAYRYGTQGLRYVLPALARETTGRLLVLPLFPQRTGSSQGTVIRLARRLARDGGYEDRLREVELAPDDPGYIDALAARCREVFDERAAPPPRLLVSFHGVPLSHDRREGGVYSKDCRRTFRALLDALQWPAEKAEICFQSKFGPGRWLEPPTEPRLVALARAGKKEVGLTAPGFLTDGLETLEELDVRGLEAFREAGGECIWRARAVADHPRLLDGLEQALRQALAA